MSAKPRPPAKTPRRRLVARLRGDRERMVAMIIERVLEQIPDYAPTVAEMLRPTTNAMIDQLLAALDGQRGPTPAELATFVEYGRERARQRISLEGVLRAWRLAIRLLLDELAAAAPASGADDRLLLQMTNELLDIVDSAILAYSRGHREVELERIGRESQQRAEFTAALLTGRVGPTELHQQAQRYGLDTGREYRAFRTRPSEAVTAEELERLLRQALHAERVFLTRIDGDLAGFTDRDFTLDAPVPIGFGTATRLADLDHSFRLASRAYATAAAFGRRGTCDFTELGLLPAVVADPELGAELVRRYLLPLGTGDATTVLVDTVAHFLESGMRVEATAARLIVHQNTVRYRIGRFEELTGCDLRSPHTALQVWWAIQHARLG
ncbi:PucR family transcriptional regulator [Nocardia sp. NPDC050406]|uniref:PucR family transcriptional regulator n=1 Tax=Nocardia sp. NPDC050406 TaxID=3364318 RepID=UPI0037B29B5C